LIEITEIILKIKTIPGRILYMNRTLEDNLNSFLVTLFSFSTKGNEIFEKGWWAETEERSK